MSGEWEQNGNAVHERMSPHYAKCICICEGEDRYENAKLLAASQKMLNLLNRLIAVHEVGGTPGECFITECREVIAKANGE